jgi:UDP-N-acetylenolpyruvoylglucosamine reductase
VTDEKVAQVVALHQADLHSGRVANLADLSAEQAATALVEAFQRTGYAEAVVSDLERTRSLVRRDCRRRRLKVQTIGAGSRIVVMDEARHDRWLSTPDGEAYKQRADRAAVEAMSAILPSEPRPLPPRPRGS